MAQRLQTDWILFLTVTVLVCFGLVMVYSSSSIVAEPSDPKKHVDSAYFFLRQLAWAFVSFLILLWAMKRDYRMWNDPKIAFAGLGLVMLLLVAVFFGGISHRWLRLGPFSLQPSELAKPALALFLAFFLSRRLGAMNEKHTLGPIGAAISLMAFLVAIADLGTAIVLVATTAIVIYVAGVDYRYLAICGAMGLLLVLGFIAAKPYRLARFIDFVDKDHKILNKIDPGGHILAYSKNTISAPDPGYQQLQSKIAVGSGGFAGLGLMESRQKLSFLPKPHTDFIYAVVGEETGFIGAFLLLTGFVIILWRGIRTYIRAEDNFGRYLALSVCVCIVVQSLVNISVVLDILPNKGIPLPFISYGGSSLLSTLLLMGMLLSVSESAA